VKYADIIFTNADEARYFASLCQFDESEDLEQVGKFMASFDKKNQTKKRIVVITNGPHPAYVVEYDFKKESFTFEGDFIVAPVKKEKIVDVNGAGDAFAGGFLAMFVKGSNLEECVDAGHWAAAQIIQTRGCQFPKHCDYFSKNY